VASCIRPSGCVNHQQTQLSSLPCNQATNLEHKQDLLPRSYSKGSFSSTVGTSVRDQSRDKPIFVFETISDFFLLQALTFYLHCHRATHLISKSNSDDLLTKCRLELCTFAGSFTHVDRGPVRYPNTSRCSGHLHWLQETPLLPLILSTITYCTAHPQMFQV
jgi:hypothetical protein